MPKTLAFKETRKSLRVPKSFADIFKRLCRAVRMKKDGDPITLDLEQILQAFDNIAKSGPQEMADVTVIIPEDSLKTLMFLSTISRNIAKYEYFKYDDSIVLSMLGRLEK